MLYFMQTYIKPGTGRRFRPISAIGRYLTQENACTATTKVPKLSKQITSCLTISDAVA